MERKIKKVGKKYHVWDEVLGWVVVDKVEGFDPIQSSPVEYKESKVLTLNDVERLS
jgi:hypothetical protein